MLERLLKDPKFLTNVVETMKEGLMVVDADGNILFFNKAAEEITGYSRNEVMGKPCVLLDSDTCVILTQSGRQRSCDLFKTGSICNKRCRIRARDGRAVYLLKNAVALRDVASGEIVGAVETMTDITSLYLKELELEELKEEMRKQYWFMGLLGTSAPMQNLYEQIRNAATSEAPVLICGESGTGKNLVAKAIHALSRRKEGPFVSLNCASLNEHLLESELFGHKKGSFTGAISDRVGRFEAAHKGTMFLDEIGDMPLIMQAKLLKVLEEKVVERVGEHKPIEVNIRLISATNHDLNKLVTEERFRQDLFYRVNSIFIQTPPLRERVEDIPLLAFHYLKKIAAMNNKDIRRISPDALEILANSPWPGNVRQLINVLDHSAITCKGDTLEVSDLPDYILHPKKIEGKGNHVDREKIRLALLMYKGNKTLAAKHLGVSRVTLWKKLKDLGME
jgi:two-component system response regulator HydG